MVLAADSLISEAFVSEATLLQHEASSLSATFDTLDTYDFFEPPVEVADLIVSAYADVQRNESNARELVESKLADIDEAIDKLIRDQMVPDGDQAALCAMFDGPDATQYDTKYMFEVIDDKGSRRIGGIGVLNAMVEVYNDLGEPEQMDEPATWAEYLRSPDKAAWTNVLVHEVEKLEDVDGGRGTWIVVPRAAAKGHVVHKSKIVFKLKTDAQRKFDKRKARFVVIGTRMLKNRDYLEKFTQGAAFGSIKMTLCVVVHLKWIRFRIDVVNAFPQTDIEREIFLELPKGPFDFATESNPDPIGLCRANLYGTPPAPRTFTTQFHNHLITHCELKPGVMDNRVYCKGDNSDGVKIAGYMDEVFGGASSIQRADWLIAKIKDRWPITVEFEWGTVLGFSADVTKDNYLHFGTLKYAREIKDRFLQGESKPSRSAASRESITKLASEKAPEIGSDEEKANKFVQSEALALNGAITHLSRGRPDIAIDSALCAQHVSRATPATLEHLKEIARYVWATEDVVTRHVGPYCSSLELCPQKEPVRPYDLDRRIEFGLYNICDSNLAKPTDSVPGSKSMGGLAIMFAGAVIEHKAYRFHTLTPDVCSCETMVASRGASRSIFYRGTAQHLGVPQVKPTPLFTDNDGTWYVAVGGASATSMTYIIRHVRFLQQCVQEEEIACFQMDGMLNPVDALTKWLVTAERKRHYAFLNGYHMEALELWLASSQYRAWKPKKIEAVPSDAPVRPKEAVEHDKTHADLPKKQQIKLGKELVNQLAADDEHDSDES